MPKVNEISVTFSTDGLGANEKDVIEQLNDRFNIKCDSDWFNSQFTVSAKGVGIEYIHKAVNESVERVNSLKRKNEAVPLDTSVRFRVNAPLEMVASFVEETEFNVEGIHAYNVGYSVVVSSDLFNDKHLTEYVGKYFDIV